MHVEFSYAHFEWSFFAVYHYFYNQNINFVEQSAWKKVALLFNGATRRGSISWLILQQRRTSIGRPYFCRSPYWIRRAARVQARNYANCRNLHTTRTI